MNLLRFSSFSLLCTSILFFVVITYADASALQVSPTITLEDSAYIYEGTVIVVTDEGERYAVSTTSNSQEVFGVTATRPALVFSTGADQMPVITEGVALVQVNNSAGQIKRGDVLITSTTGGVATQAGEGDLNVFAIALEDYSEVSGDITGLIQAEIGVERAQLALSARQNNVSKDNESRSVSTLARAGVSAVLVIGALFFILYSFRTTLSQGVVSVGRNPRARSSIVALAFGNILFAIILFAIVIFIAVAILILPV